MRTPIALAIYLSLAAASFAEEPPRGRAPEWKAIYLAGIDASQNRHDEEALSFFKQSWETSDTAEEKGASANNLGQTYRRLGRTNEAKLWLERALQAWIADPHPGSRLAVTASTLADLDRSAGDYTAAERTLRQTLDSPGLDPESKALVRNDLAGLLREIGRTAEAQVLFEQSLEVDAVSPRERAGALIGLADIERSQGNRDASVARWNEALEICRREGDERSEAVALLGLALTWLRSGAPARAEPLLRRSLRMMENNPDTLPEEVAGAHSGLAELYSSENKPALAEIEWTRALEIDRSALGEGHPQVAWLMEMLAGVYSARGEFQSARDYATRASEIMIRAFGETSMPAAAALTNDAIVEQSAGDFAAAAKDYVRAIEIARLHPENRPLKAVMIQRYADLLKAIHRKHEAKAILAQSGAETRSFRLE
jgi:tetratricopeptide (TPR) repeat protein